MRLLGVAATLFALHAPGAASARERPRPAVHVAAAANLKPALEEIARAFEAARGVEVRATYGSSSAFYAQLRSGARYDLFLSAEAALPAELAAAGLADGPPFTYARGALVVWVPRDSTLDLEGQGLAALAGPSVRRIAIANPRVAPYGRAAEQALRAAGVYDRVKERLVLGQNAAQAAQFVQSGAAQAGLLPLSLALAPPLSDAGRRWPVPEGSHDRIEQAGVVLRGAGAALGRDLAAFLVGPGRAVLARSGYAVP